MFLIKSIRYAIFKLKQYFLNNKKDKDIAPNIFSYKKMIRQMY